jgi:HNH endonuclease
MQPCWELKYCPYGPLVEEFPLKLKPDERSCRIFGHDCPVFQVAEPFTETRQLRNISRSIPRVVQFRVLKRENQICAECGNSVMDADVEFDHIIPWSKGGSSDESNIRLLCNGCNRRRGTAFEKQFLVESVREHLVEPSGIEIVEWHLMIARFGWEFNRSEDRLPAAGDYASEFVRGEISTAEQFAAQQFADIVAFFSAKRPTDVTARIFKALKLRWGASDGRVHRILEVTRKMCIAGADLVHAERDFVRRLGFSVKDGVVVDARLSKL